MMIHVRLVALFLLGQVANVFAANECGVCQCCTNRACDSRNVCTQGCIDGYYGEGCFNACIENCLRCTQYTYCSSCKDGFYPPNCYGCPSNCLTCSSWSSCQSCKDGYYNGYRGVQYYGNCHLACQTKCAACNSYSTCTKCNEGKYGTQCDNECPEGCQRCDFETGNCIDGCLPGDWGDKCQYKCPSTCKTCSTDINCSLCNNGFYGAVCNEPCPKNCADNVCDKTSGACFKCDPGYYGHYCNNICPSNCFGSECNFGGICLSCKAGFYSNNCTLSCPGTNCGTCHMADGVCTKCVNGYFGSSCEMKCPEYCKDGSACSKSDGFCQICSEGFYYLYRNCDKKCDAQCKTCNYNSWKCTKCRDDLYNRAGTYYLCNLQCSKKCINSTCDDDTGYCVYDCVVGYWGHTCNQLCPTNCKNGDCFKENGTCIAGCTDGYTGNKCKCPQNCQCNVHEECIACNAGFYNYKRNCTCRKEFCSDEYCTSCSNETMYALEGSCCQCTAKCKDGICESQNKCTKGCIDGFFGDDCSHICNNYDAPCNKCTFQNNMFKCLQCHIGYYPNNSTNSCQHCSNHCVNKTCNSSNGICSNGCKPGRWGARCERYCSNYCEQCNQESGECEVCKSGKYLKDCSQSCSPNCNSTGNVGSCGIDDGQCLNGCTTFTRYGSHCENQCSSNCKDGKCEWTTGKCLEGCVNNTHYGAFCNDSCSHNCIRDDENVRTCNESNGYCIGGCVGNFYGDTCEKECSPNCANKTCDRSSGNCVRGCLNGYIGLRCLAMTLKNGAGTTTAIIGGAAGTSVLLLIIGGVIAIIVILKRRRRQNKDEAINTTDRVSDAIAYSNMSTPPAEHVNIGTVNLTRFSKAQDAIDAKPNKTKKPDADNRKKRESPKVNVGKEFAAITAIYENTVLRRTLPRNDGGDQMKDAHELRVIATESTLEEEDFDAGISSNECEKNGNEIAGIPEVSDTCYNAEALKRRRINVDELDKHILKKNQDDFDEEFQQLPVGLIKPYTVSQRPTNRSKNRYKGIYPYDETRVVLTDGDSDYINANYINGYNKSRAYIASIGPTIKYMGDMSVFWIMIWQEKVGKIVILTRLTEAGTQKFDQYYPDEGTGLMFSDIMVTCKSEEHYAEYTVRIFVVERASEKRNIVQVHFTSWPDKGIPDDVVSLIECREKVTSINTELDGPILVHCSAGIGRTGTYIALDSLIFEGEAEGEVDIFACVRNLREQRMNMVQTAEQYGFLYHVLAHRFALDSKPVDASCFCENFESHAVDRLDEQFKKLQACIDQRLDGENEAVNTNKKFKQRNREGGDTPEASQGNLNRPRLYLGIETGGSDYINAVYVNSFRSANRYIIAQTPLPKTVEDFLTLIIQENVSCVIDMEPPTPKEKSVGVYYLADNQTLNKGKITIKPDPGVTTDQYIYRKLHVKYKGKETNEDRVVGDIQYTQWNEGNAVPDDPARFVQFIKDVEMNYCNGERSGPVLIRCLSGARKSGLFCVVSTLIEKLQSDQQISVINTVRQIKNRRHMAIPYIDQFKFCHQCVHEYLKSFDTYANIGLQR